MDSDSVKAIARIFKPGCLLSHLDLSKFINNKNLGRCGLENNDVEELCKGLKFYNCLTYLNLGDNNIYEVSEVVASVISSCPKLSYLNLSTNYFSQRRPQQYWPSYSSSNSGAPKESY